MWFFWTYLALLCKCEAEQRVASGRVADTGPSVYICAPRYREAAFALSPPNTKFVWVAASGDKMAISTVSQPSISFQQLEGRRRSLWVTPLPPPLRLPSKIDWTETIRLSEREKGVEVWNQRPGRRWKNWLSVRLLGEKKKEVSGNRRGQNEGKQSEHAEWWWVWCGQSSVCFAASPFGPDWMN